jgi:hypothetical protein
MIGENMRNAADMEGTADDTYVVGTMPRCLFGSVGLISISILLRNCRAAKGFEDDFM